MPLTPNKKRERNGRLRMRPLVAFGLMLMVAASLVFAFHSMEHQVAAEHHSCALCLVVNTSDPQTSAPELSEILPRPLELVRRVPDQHALPAEPAAAEPSVRGPPSFA
jgi:hypothetical protein